MQGCKRSAFPIDGLRDVHDRLRGVKGSFDAAFKALQLDQKFGITSSVNTQITSLVIPQLRELMELFIAAGAKSWQVQLTVAMGRAADHPELLLQPYELLELMPLLAELYQEGADRGFLLLPGNNIGYFGPYESLWRGSGDDRVYWTSCNAGQNTLGIEADGTIKGCPSLPTSPYAGGNIRDLSLETDLVEDGRAEYQSRPNERRVVGLLWQLLLRRRVQSRLHLDHACLVRTSREQSLLPPSGAGVIKAGTSRKDRAGGKSAWHSFRSRAV